MSSARLVCAWGAPAEFRVRWAAPEVGGASPDRSTTRVSIFYSVRRSAVTPASRRPILAIAVVALAGARPGSAQDVEPICDGCPATFVGADEIAAYRSAIADLGIFLDQRIRTVDVGESNVSIALVHRGRLERTGAVAEHSLVTEVYYVLSGSGTTVTGVDMTGVTPRSEDNRAVRLLNGPGHSATGLRDPVEHHLEVGDVLIIPGGTGHQFTRIDDHISYLQVRFDPLGVIPVFGEEEARAELEEQREQARRR